MSEQYTIDYFIEKFKNIPVEKWIRYHFELGDCHCAMGHCGAHVDPSTSRVVMSPESNALNNIFIDAGFPSVYKVNDCEFDREFVQANPKQRILHALKLAKEKVASV